MNLDFGSKYDGFRDEVKEFCNHYQGVQLKGTLGNLFGHEEIKNSKKQDLKISIQDWQKILIEHGYFARNIPIKYGGYGGELDIVKNVIKAISLCLLVILSFFFLLEWDNNNIRIFASIYVANDLMGIVMCKHLPTSTRIHHMTTILFLISLYLPRVNQ